MKHFEYTDVIIMIPFAVDSNDFSGMHDAIIDATDKHLNQAELIEVFNSLPDDLKSTAIAWGMQDTVFRDNLYEYAQKNIEKFAKFTTWKD